MNPRVLELLKNPKNIQSEDLNLLKEEINSFPYIQNIRALHLYGIHLYDKENYQKELSTTAAYTTDKKILYQLINGKIKQKPKPEIIEEQKPLVSANTFKYIYKSSSFPIKREEKEQQQIIKEEQAEQIVKDKKHEEAFLLQAQIIPEIKHLHVDGERNRILFEGEENFLNDDTLETIDLESTLESGSIVTQKAEKKEVEEVIDEVEDIQEEPISEEVQQENPVEEISEFTPETIINEEKVDSIAEEEKIDDEADVSYHEIEPSLTESELKEDHLVEENDAVSFENEELNEVEAKIEFTPEEIINEEEITSESETEKVNNDAELSFHGTDSFLPDVKIQSNTVEETVSEEIPQPNINKHEDEMRRLIEEVEKKMKTVKVSSEQKETEPEISGHEISFAETQSFNVEEPAKEKIEEKTEEEKPELVENKPEEVEPVEETVNEELPEEKPVAEAPQEVKSAWKPMSLESHVPDSLLNKSTETPQPKVEEVKEEAPKQEEIVPQAEEVELPKENSEEIEAIEEPVVERKIKRPETVEEDEEEEEAPALNVSFFNSDIISSWAVDANKAKEEQQKEKEEIVEIPAEKINPIDSNVPGFINTWQSWLKIDRPSDETEETVEDVEPIEEAEPVDKVKTEIKNKVIESFIENNPKISQLKDEVNFVVKEKTDDISHLMTETLATLYFEQKLYTKAIKAFNILITKHPEKKEYFEGKIQEIKDIRGKN
ncbi:hypothetical protein A0O34_10130 [Chryseobacterium glaciei]|uniref:Uncharacterized protein n=1 Tax=Chryseobacterium glaciei TaxID=1685010 RepID=A0A172XV14_9FLAO|nr:hypothetical protein [Chryseobacterium glaciei]ANF50853.1 hypothetical protein A0O34_10130 [Chryseobacterium glaciei]